MTRIKKRRIEITASESQHVFIASTGFICPVCHRSSELLTVRQAGDLTQVTVSSVRRWAGKGLIHGIKTPGGRYRICRTSLWNASPPSQAENGQLVRNSMGSGVVAEVLEPDQNALAMCLKAAKSALGSGKQKSFIPEE